MNCKQTEGLLPLLAGHDLDEKRTQLVSAHVQTCAACAGVLNEYQEAFQLTQQFAAPVFSEEVYGGIRRRVLREIETESRPPALTQLAVSWFRPRMAWAVAGALIIGLGFFALYLIVSQQPNVQQVAGKNPSVNRHQDDSKSTVAAPTTTHSNTPSKRQRPEDKRRGVRHVMNQPTFVATKSRDSSSVAAKVVPKGDDLTEPGNLPADEPVPNEAPLRVEIQTNDPNIRIIWFSQPATKPALPNLKGT